jgi:3-methylfumaryl-CoA hydratase
MMGDSIPQDLQAWVGREETQTDSLTLFPARGMAALLDRDPDDLSEGAALPECWHWLYFKPVARQSRLGPDGHALRGGFLPPVTLPRRMWAGGRLRFLQPLTLGEHVVRRSRILSVEEKEGSTGALVRVTVLHTIDGESGPAVEEEQDLIYREAPKPGGARAKAQALPDDIQWTENFLPDAVVLFRFSALTFNGHRIHYDYPYCTEVEGYPGLVVHGPLIALLLLDAAKRRMGQQPSAFDYRAVGPLFGDDPVTLAGRTTESGDETGVWAAGPRGTIATQAKARWAS